MRTITKWAAGAGFIALGFTAVADEATSTPAPSDPVLKCNAELTARPEFSDIVAKLPLPDMAHIPFSMLANESLPTAQERTEIAAWFDGFQKCWDLGAPTRQATWPPEIFQLSMEGKTGIEDIGADLYNSKITYGEANKRLQALGNSITGRLIPIIKQYQAQLAAEQETARQQAAAADAQARQQAANAQAVADARALQEQQLRQQRLQMFMNYMQATRPSVPTLQPIPQPQTHSMNCIRNGNYTNCTGN
jgi:hypothetical protein